MGLTRPALRVENFLHADPAGNDSLLDGVTDDRFEHPAVRLDPVGQRIADDIHHALEELIVCVLRDSRRQARDVEALRVGKRLEQVRRDIGICGEHGGEPSSVEFCHQLELNYVSCSPFRVPIARLAAAQAAIGSAVRDR